MSSVVPETELSARGSTASRLPLFISRYALIVALIVALIISLAFFSLRHERELYRERASIATQNIVQLLDQNLSGAFDKIDLVLRSITLRYRDEAALGRLDAAWLNRYLAQQQALLPEVLSLRVADQDGLVHRDGGADQSPVDLSDRDYFIRARDDPAAGLAISVPIFARISQQWVIVLARRLSRADGSFAGVVYANIAATSFDKPLSSVALGPRGAATIRTTDMALLHRWPDTKNSVGVKNVSQQLRDNIALHPERGEYTAISAIDGIERSNAYRKLARHPFYVIVGMATEDYLGLWEEELLKRCAQALLTILITLIAAVMIYRFARRLQEDIAARMLSEERLRHALKDLEEAQRIGRLGSWQVDLRSGAVLWSDEMYHLFDMAPGLAPTRAAWLNAIHPDDRARAEQVYRDSLAGHSPFTITHRVLRRDGAEQHVQVMGQSFFADDGAPLRSAGTMRDVTAAVLHEKFLRESEQRFSNLINHNNAIILQIDPASGRIIDANAAAVGFYGWSHEQLCGKAIQEINQLDPEQIKAERALAAQEKRNYFIYPHRLANQDIRTVEVHSTPVPMGERTVLVSIIHDVTERVRDARQLEMLIREQKAILGSRIVGIVRTINRKFLWVNEEFAGILGYSAAELTDLPTRVIYPSDEAYHAFGEASYPTMRRAEIFRADVQFRCKDGAVKWIDIGGSALYPGGAESIWAVVDISERKLAVAALRESESRFRIMADNAPVLIGIAGPDRRCTWVNQTWLDFTGRGIDQETGNGWADGLHPDDRPACLARYVSAFDARARFTMEYRLRRFDGKYRWLSISGVPRFDGDGVFLGYIGSCIDIDERRQVELQVQQLAFYDALTALPNRRLFEDRLNQAISAGKRGGQHAALIFLDLDNFKPLNDTHGHAVGDSLLIEVAARLKRCVREVDTLARLGGDEFVVLLTELDTDKERAVARAGIVAEKIRLSLAESYRLTVRHDGKPDLPVEHHCSASLGVAMFNGDDARAEDIVKRADAAMYQAKQAGRNMVQFYA